MSTDRFLLFGRFSGALSKRCFAHHKRIPRTAPATANSAAITRNATNPSTRMIEIMMAPTTTTKALAIGLAFENTGFGCILDIVSNQLIISHSFEAYKNPRTMASRSSHRHSIARKTVGPGQHPVLSTGRESPQRLANPGCGFYPLGACPAR